MSESKSKINLKRSGKYTPRSKFVLKNSIPANDLTSQDQKISGYPSNRNFYTDSLAIDNVISNYSSNSSINISIPQSVKDVDAFIQSCRKLNCHDDIILRTPTLSTGEIMFTMCFKSSKDNGRIIEFDYPECEKDILEIMKDLRWNAEKNILAIQK